jgi:hypothetical protein
MIHTDVDVSVREDDVEGMRGNEGERRRREDVQIPITSFLRNIELVSTMPK